METMERKKPRPRRSFTPEFKAEIVELCQRGDRSIDLAFSRKLTTAVLAYARRRGDTAQSFESRPAHVAPVP